ncbi:DUF1573 domain-containing protein [Maribellus comscasis]|uniref:DUF1573 domain-containing protein n=1 Tax=Maribellus comscasis TaxID=2681766 RepID=A0A6I6JWD4_9BACT|nr:DUF1573 domain-containing protein [Maribellus comscasis]QGY45440.1 DUF1573 domain-containing protein [Maribellus comscasis]
MKNMLLTLLVAFLFSCGNRNEQKSKATQQETNVITEFEFSKEMHNFGSLQAGEIVVFTFEFKNSGENNLLIQKVETDCGCMRAEFSKENVLPGESGIIEVEFDSSGLWGKQFKTIEVYANTKKPKQLAIFAEVLNEEIEIKY